MNKLIALLSLFCFLQFQCFSQQIETDRPDQTESSSLVPFKSLQIETGYLFDQNDDGVNALESQTTPTTLLRLGVSKLFELRIVNDLYALNYGINPNKLNVAWQIGTKIKILNSEKYKTKIAFLSHLVFPKFEGVFNSNYGTINRILISREFGERINIGANIGYDYFEEKGNLTYTLALGLKLSEKFGFFIEPFGEYSNLEEFVNKFDCGFTFLPTEKIQLDVYAGTSLHKKSIEKPSNLFVGFGVSWLLHPLK